MAGIRSGGCAALACAVLGIAGCKSFPTQEFNKDANGGVRSIAVAPIGLPDAPNIVILNAVGNSFGLIGGLVEATRASNASKEATAELAAAGLNYKTYIPAQIESALRDAGFEVVMLPGSRPAADSNKFLDALPATPGADALLDIYIDYVGYAAAGAKSPYHPAVHLQAQMTDLKTRKVLFADQIYYNNFVPAAAKRAISIEPDPQAVFADRAAMRAAPEQVAKDLRAALDAVAAELAKQLK